MPISRYGLVAFDLDGTLVAHDEPIWKTLHTACGSDLVRRKAVLRAAFAGEISYADWFAADIAMLAMLKIQRCPRLKQLGYKLLMQIHDEVILEGPVEHEEEALALTKAHMQNPFEDANGENVNLLDVELVVDGDSAKTWMDAK